MTELKINARRGNAARGVCEVMATEKAELTDGVNLFGKDVLEFAGQVMNLRVTYDIENGRKATTWYDCVAATSKRFDSTEDFLAFAKDAVEDFFPCSQCVLVAWRARGICTARVFVSAVRLDGEKLILRSRNINSLARRFASMCGEKGGGG